MNNNINQISIFDTIFGGNEPTQESSVEVTVQQRKPSIGLGRTQEEVTVSCGEETESDETVETDDDSDLPDFAEIEQGADGTSAVPTKTAASTPSKKAEKPKFESLDQPWTVCYAGHKLPVTQKGITLEKIRQMLENEFPELTKERTEMTYDEKKSIVVPVVKGAKKGGAR